MNPVTSTLGCGMCNITKFQRRLLTAEEDMDAPVLRHPIAVASSLLMEGARILGLDRPTCENASMMRLIFVRYGISFYFI